ncbi:serine carboxypeptidase-like 40 [Quercus suber]|uniref:Carboxypeptidase n=1 Tax=Quercus suber TaxID=58331 RepID=A0AAW0L1W0_QUESU
MESKLFCWILLSLLILSCFVSQTNEKMQGQTLVYLYKSRLKQNFGVDTMHKSAGRALYYYFVEAHHSKNPLPLLLWLNGGPGCSSLAGALLELGPFRVHSDGKTLYTNKFSWNYAANVLFLESPAGVGFSYSNTTSDYDKSGDSRTAADNYVFLVNWLERFSEYKDRDFYISGESYAGHYIGNAVINDETDEQGMVDYFGSHAIISDQDVYQIHKYCDFSPNATSQSRECEASYGALEENIIDINVYNIYAPMCFSSDVTTRPKKASILEFDPCSINYMYVYLNRPDVQEALHANVTKLTHDWELCGDTIQVWRDSPSTIIPLLKEFMSNGIRVWIFSGDIDGRVPVTSTKYSINKMKLPVKTAWHPWFLNKEVGGYTQVYEGDLTFATVREAGHQVPSYQPARALSLIKHFLEGKPLH